MVRQHFAHRACLGPSSSPCQIEELTNAAVFLADEDSTITGTIVNLIAGMIVEMVARLCSIKDVWCLPKKKGQ
jgi:hypothetical protein